MRLEDMREQFPKMPESMKQMNVVIYPYSIEHSYIKKYKKFFRTI